MELSMRNPADWLIKPQKQTLDQPVASGFPSKLVCLGKRNRTHALCQQLTPKREQERAEPPEVVLP